MDNLSRAWAPKPGLVGTGWVLLVAAAGALTWFAGSGDRPGTLLLGVVSAALLGLCLHGTVLRPRLSADADGLRIRTLGGMRAHRWPAVDFRLIRSARFGRTVEVLELDAEGTLTVLGWVELGEDPHDVHAELLRLRQSPHSAG